MSIIDLAESFGLNVESGMDGTTNAARRALTPARAKALTEASQLWGKAWAGNRMAAVAVQEALTTSDLFKSATGDLLDRELLATYEEHGDWSAQLTPAGHALVPAVCHPLYAYLEGSQVDGTVFELMGECYRHEPSPDPMRFVTFRMFEAVRIGTPQQAQEHRERWLAAGTELLRALGLTVEADTANDPFFGRAGKLLSAGQREAQLKFEILTEVYPGHPTAIASANLHEDHFGEAFSMRTADGAVAHSACFGFGLERVALALASVHGFDVAAWPASVRQELGLS